MFGWINDCTEKLVLSKFGVAIWHEIKEKAECTVMDGGFIRHKYYPDESTVKLVVAASEVLGITVDQVLEAFGTFFMEFVRAEGFENLLQCQGNTLQSWLSNMNALHDHLESSLPPGMVAPVFWCENDDDDHEGSMILHYYSKRGNLLCPLVVGVVKEVARFHFHVLINMEMLGKQDVEQATHTSWRITAQDPKESWKITLRESNLAINAPQEPGAVRKCPFSGITFSSTSRSKPSVESQEQEINCEAESIESLTNGVCPHKTTPKTPCISSATMKTMFPYHIVIDEMFHIIQIGAALPSLMNQLEDLLIGRKINEVFRVSRPVLAKWDWDTVRKLNGQAFFIEPIDLSLMHVKFKASTVSISDPGEALQVMIVLSPDVKNVAELKLMKLTMSDLPLHSFQRDAVFLGEHLVSEVNSAHKLDRLSKKLQHEQKLSTVLLHTLLPSHVAEELRAGKTVQPELHKNVTLFFSDVVGFTEICDAIFPWDVVDLLNRLYCIMDYLCARFNLYKVETIGDSYFCASGLPKDDPDHAKNIANFAIATMHCSKLVANPVTGDPIKLRIGIHSGPCMTGVVGMKAPHYCLFGDTVNTASRHESTSVAGKIQCSSVTYGLLQHFSDKNEFTFNPRGLVDMKGKGLMATYFLDGPTAENTRVSPEELEVLCGELENILRNRTFTNKRYFKRYGRRDSDFMFGGSFTGSTSSHLSDDFDESDFVQQEHPEESPSPTPDTDTDVDADVDVDVE